MHQFAGVFIVPSDDRFTMFNTAHSPNAPYIPERPSMSRGTNGKGRSKMSVDEAASREGVAVYHTGQGQDERARPRPAPLLRGLDSAWSLASNPHRESGTRWRAAADVGAGQGRGSRSAEGRRGNRLA